MIKSGIYSITNIETNNCYIGSSIDLPRRKREHFKKLISNEHVNQHFQNAFNKYGIDNFEFLIVEEVQEKEKLIEREQFYIDLLKPEYNICQTAGSRLGMKHSLEIIEKIRLSSSGRTHSEETKKMLSVQKTGVSINIGTNNSKSKITEKDVLAIREKYMYMTSKQLMKEYNLSKRSVDLILRGKSWTHITNGISIKKDRKYFKKDKIKVCKPKTYLNGSQLSQSKLNENNVFDVIEKYRTGNYIRRELAELYNVSIHTINNILYGRSWKHCTGGKNINKG